MALLPMKNLWLSSLLLLLLGSCSSPYRNLQPAVGGNSARLVLPFEALDRAVLYKAAITRNDDYYSGLLLIKQMAGSTYRIVMTSELGPKIFDFEISRDDFITHYLPEQMNRKLVLDMIEKDFRLIFFPFVPQIIGKTFSDSENLHTVHKMNSKRGFNYCYLENKTGNLARVDYASRSGKQKNRVDFSDYKNGLPGKIRISHSVINLVLQFELLER